MAFKLGDEEGFRWVAESSKQIQIFIEILSATCRLPVHEYFQVSGVSKSRLTDNIEKRIMIIRSGISHTNACAGGVAMEAMKDYVAHLDNKKRITLRGATYQYYNVKEYGNGCIILEPRELAVPESISAKTLADMDRAVSNFKRGDVSPAIDLSDF